MLKQNSPGGLSPYLDAGAQRIAAELEAHLVITLKHTGRHCGAALGGVPPPHQPIGATSFSPFRMGGCFGALSLGQHTCGGARGHSSTCMCIQSSG